MAGKRRRSDTAVDVSSPDPVPDVEMLITTSLKRTHEMFLLDLDQPVPFEASSQRIRVEAKIADEYDSVKHVPPPVPVASAKAQKAPTPLSGPGTSKTSSSSKSEKAGSADVDALVESVASDRTARLDPANTKERQAYRAAAGASDETTRALALRPRRNWTDPQWHAPWRLFRVISGHLQWVRALAVDVGNEWFASGSGDRTIKLWDLASGSLKLTLTGHVSAVRGLAISDRHPYLYSCGEDKMVRCWDLETNKTIRSYHGHNSGVYCCSLHPTLDVLVTGGRDASVRVWDVRTKAQVHLMSGHSNTVASVATQAAEPQVISGSQDSTVRLWDLRSGKASAVLTQHKKGVRALVVHPKEYAFASASPWTVKQWRCPNGDLLSTLRGHDAILNTMSLNRDDVLFSGGDDGTMAFWDWKTGYKFQSTSTLVQPGSLESEAGIFSSTFDRTGSRLITGEGDKTIKVWKEDENATPETHPVRYKPDTGSSRW